MSTPDTSAISDCSEHKPQIRIPRSFNYIAAFVTLRCPYKCSYCINSFDKERHTDCKEMNGGRWISALTRLNCNNIPITIQGGEPGSHPDFVAIVQEVSKTHALDILSNLAFDLHAFVDNVDPHCLNRAAPYAPIRVSYHPEQFSLNMIIEKIMFLQNNGFRVGLYGVMHPDQHDSMRKAAKVCAGLGIDFRTKPFMGWHNGKLYGKYGYPNAVGQDAVKTCDCAPSELLIAPNGYIYPCHHHLYGAIKPSKHIEDPCLSITDDFHKCKHLGQCNPCDLKIKNDRCQRFGHVAVTIQT